MTPTLHLRLLGDFQLTHDGATVNGLSPARLQSLLAYLALHRASPQPRRHLAFLLWPDSIEVQARTNLRHLLHQLREIRPEGDQFLRRNAHLRPGRMYMRISCNSRDWKSEVTALQPQKHVCGTMSA